MKDSQKVECQKNNVGEGSIIDCMGNPRIILSDEENQILNGCLLGDGHLRKPRGQSSYFQYKSSQLFHVEYIYNWFGRLASQGYKDGPRSYSYYDKRYKKTFIGYIFCTQSNITFYKLRQQWYPEGKKIVPRDLELTPLTCLLWYIGDGSLSKAKQHNIKLSTDGFKSNDVDFLIETLNKLGFEATKVSVRRNQYAIHIPRRNVKKFLDYIGPCPVECYSYKWGYRDYIFPERDGKRKRVLQFDLDNNLVRQWESLRQIQRELGFFWTFISACCRGLHEVAYGYKWQFALPK
jgi:hypothetical protein